MRNVHLALAFELLLAGPAAAEPFGVRDGASYTRAYRPFAPETAAEQVQLRGSAQWHHATGHGESVETSAQEWGLGILRRGKQYMFDYHGMSHVVNGVAADLPVSRKSYTLDDTMKFARKDTPPEEIAFVVRHLYELLNVPSGLSKIWSNRTWRGKADVTLDARDRDLLARELGHEFPGVVVTSARTRLVRELRDQLTFEVVLALSAPGGREAVVSGELITDGRVLELELAGTDLAGGTVKLARYYVYARFPNNPPLR